MNREVTILGAGCTGPLLGAMLARHGAGVQVYERRPDPRSGQRETGRSINLALAARGLHALEQAGLRENVTPWLVPMRGRLLHAPDGTQTLLPYGQRANELIWSVPRAQLNEMLLDAAEARGVAIHYGQRCVAADYAAGTLSFDDGSGAPRQVPMTEARPVFGADGAGSVLRRAMVEAGLTTSREEFLDHAYKELSIPAGAGGRHRMEREALHIWPRGRHMLIALPNSDGTFTATLFLARDGEHPSFASLTDERTVEAFFADNFPDALALMPDLIAEFFAHPAGLMGTVHVARWNVGGRSLLVGDAAHAIVPFHGQGMNCAFEDCVLLDSMLWNGADWKSAFADFDRLRRVDAAAIARMAIENYAEMRDRVRDPSFQLQKELALELERRHPTRFVPRYSMVSFRADIPYSEAERRGALQQQILGDALDGLDSLAAVDYGRVARRIEASLTPLAL